MKILFHAINGIGLGHVIRTKRIADSLCEMRPDVDIIFATNTKYTEIFKKTYKMYALKKDTKEVVEQKYTYDEYLQYNTMALEKIITHECPDIFIFDCDFSQLLLHFCKQKSIKMVYILRNSTSERFSEIKKYFPLFDKIIIPHNKKDVPPDQRECLDLYSAAFVGPITDPYIPSKEIVRANILITLGTGVNISDNQPLFSAVDSFLKFLRENNFLIDNHQVNVDIVTGPYYEEGCDFTGFKVRATTDSLVRDMYNAKIVISGAGYNTVNEILSSKTPAVVVPLPRRWDDQFQRAEELEKLGCIKVVTKDIFNSVQDILDDWQSYHKNFFDMQSGNIEAGQILSDILDLEEVKIYGE